MRHRWEAESELQPERFVAVYKIMRCSKCGLIRLHKLEGRSFSKSFLKDGKELGVMPLCE